MLNEADPIKPSIWQKAFLAERSSIGLSFFRPFVAFTVGAHVIPTLLDLKDNYLAAAFKEKNGFFFTPQVLDLIDKSPDALVYAVTAFFYLTLFSFAIGFYSQASCVLMTLCCYYFYALNALHVGTLSFDILLVTLFLMCVTRYHGDSFSVDALRRKRSFWAETNRPFFIQRLLQLQIASTYFYTALGKITGAGNWLTSNPMLALWGSSHDSVVKQFPGRLFLIKHPDLCYTIGLGVIGMELALPFLLFIKRTRIFGITAGFLFHVLLLVTLHVPTIFFFLFPPQLLLFIPPEIMSKWKNYLVSPNSSAVKT